jgi:hypothetical protein
VLWAFPLISLGKTRALEREDVFDLRKEDSAHYQDENFSRVLTAKLVSATSRRPLFWAIVSHFRWDMLTLIFLSLTSIIADMISSTFIALIATFLMDTSIDYWKGFVLLIYLAGIKMI